MTRIHFPSRAGFTLVELLAVILVVGILGLGLGEVLIQGTRIQQQAAASRLAQYHLQNASAHLLRDMRAMGDRSLVTVFGSQALAFTTSGGDSVSYASSGSELQRNGVPVAQYLSDWELTYREEDGDTALAAADLFLVNLDLEVTVGGQAYSGSYTAFPRSLAE